MQRNLILENYLYINPFWFNNLSFIIKIDR